MSSVSCSLWVVSSVRSFISPLTIFHYFVVMVYHAIPIFLYLCTIGSQTLEHRPPTAEAKRSSKVWYYDISSVYCLNVPCVIFMSGIPLMRGSTTHPFLPISQHIIVMSVSLSNQIFIRLWFKSYIDSDIINTWARSTTTGTRTDGALSYG